MDPNTLKLVQQFIIDHGMNVIVAFVAAVILAFTIVNSWLAFKTPVKKWKGWS